MSAEIIPWQNDRKRILSQLIIALALLNWMGICRGDETTYRLSGGKVSYSESGQALAEGDVRLQHGQIEILADVLEWDVEHSQVTAKGNVRIISQDRRLQGDTLSLNLASETGSMIPAEGEFHALFLKAERIEMLPDRLVAYNAKITTCDRQRPHYQIATRRVDIYFVREQGQPTPDRLEVKSARLEFHGSRIISTPPFRISLREEAEAERSLPLPYPGYSKDDGPFLRFRWNSGPPEDRPNLEVDCRTTRDRGTRAAAHIRYPLRRDDLLQVTISHREDLRDHHLGPRDIDTGLGKALVDRRPEVSLYMRPRPIRESLRWEALASAGRYREEPTDVSAERTALLGRLLLGPYPIGDRLRLEGASAYRFSAYSGDSESGVFYNRVTLATEPSKRLEVSLSLVGRDSAGSTPFLFDRVDLSRELSGEVGLSLSERWRIRLLERYDLRRHESRDVGVELTYRAHCLDYSLGWRESRGLFELGVNVVLPERD